MPIVTQLIRIETRRAKQVQATITTAGASWGGVSRVKSDAKLYFKKGEFSSGVPFTFRIDEPLKRIELFIHPDNYALTTLTLQLVYDDSLPYVTIRSTTKGSKGSVVYHGEVASVPHTGQSTKVLELAV